MKKLMLALIMVFMCSAVIADEGCCAEKSKEHPWVSYKPGTMAQWVNKIGTMSTEIKWTVKSNDGKTLVYEMETIMEGKTLNKQDVTLELVVKEEPAQPVESQFKKVGTEKITVGAGEFECEVLEGPNDVKIWKCEKVPFTQVVKMTTPAMTQELVKYEEGK